jgi:hypothetical protein
MPRVGGGRSLERVWWPALCQPCRRWVGGWEFNHSHTRLIVATLLKIKINIHKKLTIELVETKFPEIL